MLRLNYGGACPAPEVGLVVQPAALHSLAARPAVVAAANLLARWVPKLSVHMPWNSKTQAESLATDVEEAVRTANPFLEIRWGEARTGHPSLTIGPGAPASRNGASVWADGWVAVSARGPSSACRAEPITSVLLFAVALGVGRVFRDAWGISAVEPAELRWDTWQHSLKPEPSDPELPPLPPGPPELGRVLQVGAGAVGSNIIYFLGLMGASADLLVLDHDVVKIENLDRSLLFGLQHAHPCEMPKVEAVDRAVESFPSVRICPVRSKWAEYAADGYRVGGIRPRSGTGQRRRCLAGDGRGGSSVDVAGDDRPGLGSGVRCTRARYGVLPSVPFPSRPYGGAPDLRGGSHRD